MPIHGYQNYVDKWDKDHVHMPCSPSNVTVRKKKKFVSFGNVAMSTQKSGKPRWPTIQKALNQLEYWCEAKTATIENVQVTFVLVIH